MVYQKFNGEHSGLMPGNLFHPPQLPQILGADSFLKNLAIDDFILIGLIFLLLKEKTEDKLLVLALGYLFLSGLDLDIPILKNLL